MKIARHFEKREKKILKRVTAFLCAAALLFVTVPQGAFSVFAEEAAGVTASVTDASGAELTSLKLELGAGKLSTDPGADRPGSATLTLSLKPSDSSLDTITGSWRVDSTNQLVTVAPASSGADAASVDVTITPVAGKYGQETVTLVADGIKRTAASAGGGSGGGGGAAPAAIAETAEDTDAAGAGGAGAGDADEGADETGDTGEEAGGSGGGGDMPAETAEDTGGAGTGGEAPAASTPTDISGTVTVNITVDVYYQPTLALTVSDGTSELADNGSVPYKTTLTASATDANIAGLLTSGAYAVSYSWKDGDGSEVKAEESATSSYQYLNCTPAGKSYSVVAALEEKTANSHIVMPAAAATKNFTVTKAVPTVTFGNLPEVTYGDTAEKLGSLLFTASSSVPGKLTVNGTEITLDGTAAADVPATVFDVTSAQDGKTLDYTFTPTDAGNYETLQTGVTGYHAITYNVKKRPITVNLSSGFVGKNFDGTTAYPSTASFNLAENNTAAAAENVITYGEYKANSSDPTAFADSDKGKGWQLQNVTASALSYNSAGDVSADTPVGITVQDMRGTAAIAFSDGGSPATYTTSANYEVQVICTAEVTITKNDFTAGEVYVLPDGGHLNNGVTWYKGADGDNTKIEVEPAPTYTTPGDPTSGVSGYAYTLSADAVWDPWPGTSGGSVKVAPDSGNSAKIYAQRAADGLIGELVISNIAVDNTAPTIAYTGVDAVRTVGGIDFSNKDLIYTFTVTDGESGVDTEAVYYVTTENADKPDDTAAWVQVPSNKFTNGTGTFTVTASDKSYVWIKAADHVGNVKITDSVRALVIETTAPSVTLTLDGNTASSGTASQWSKSHTISINAEDTAGADSKYSGIFEIEYSLKDGDGTVVASGEKGQASEPASLADLANVQNLELEDIQSYASATVPFPDAATMEGSYTLEVKVTDYCGNTTDQTLTLNYDNTAPTIKASMSGGMEKVVEGNTVHFYKKDNCGVTVNMEDSHSDLKKYTVTLTDEKGTALSATLDDAGAANTTNANIEVTNESSKKVKVLFNPEAVEALTDGKITLTATAKDAAPDPVNSNPGSETNKLTEFTGMDQAGTDADGNVIAASFQFDLTPPEISLITSQKKTTAPSDNSNPTGPYENDYYYNGDIELQFTVDDRNCDELTLSYKKDGAEQPTKKKLPKETGGDPDSSLFSCTLSEDGRYTEIKIIGQDASGNPLTVAAEADQSGWAAWSKATGADNPDSDGNGVVTLSTNKIIDKEAPVAEIIYTSDADYKEYTSDSNSNKEYYYNQDVKATISVSDDWELDTGKLSVVPWFEDNSQTGLTLTVDENDKTKCSGSYSTSEKGEGAYSIAIYGTDRAGNPVRLTEKLGENGPTITNDASHGSEYKPEYSIVVDKTAPKVSFLLSPGGAANPQRQTSYGDRFYFNSSFTAAFTVTEKNVDTSIQAMFGTTNPDNYMNESVTANTNMTSSTSGDKTSFTWEAGSDGIYVFSISGHDKAGNEIVLDSDASGSGLGNDALQITSGGTFTSYLVVRDTAAPELDIAVGNYYAAKLTKDSYSVSANMPYRKENSALLSYKGADASPILVEYQLYSSISNPGPGKTGGSYAMNESGEYTVQGEQVFAIESLSVTDLAGNKVEAAKSVDNRVSNLIYLDVTAPDEDQLAPTVRFTAHESGQGRSQAGVELYNGTVTVDATITDPGFSNVAGGKSSGLYAVYYEVLHNDAEDWTSMMSGRVRSGGTGSETGAVYYASGKDYKEVGNERLTGQDTLTFTFDAAQFNYNDISIRVWAEDNSGNLLGKNNVAVYRFGIDTSTPSIRVSYDNNDVQNDKYFKADRTATVVVQERNFDPDNTRISAAGGSVSGWAYARGASANGDDDTWTCTVSYTTDGDYTFDVSTTDLVGHAAGEADYSGSAAPRDFTVDKTPPEIAVTFDNDAVQNGIYYKEPRMATIAITEHNFEASAAQVTMTASIAEGETSAPVVSTWGSSGDENIATAYFEQDGDYTMDVAFTDLAGNQAEPFAVSKFVIDQTAPTIEIGGVEDKHAYNGQVSPSITYHDVNYDNTSAGISITGVKHEGGQNLPGTASDDAFGGSFICDNIESVKDNDDVYTVTGSVSDLAGNVSEATLVFSINRFGSNYVIIDKTTQELLDAYYTNNPQDVQVTEINVTELSDQEVTNSLNGELPVTLEKDRDYTIKTSNPGWFQSDYNIIEGNFEAEGNYVITLSSTDEAQNTNSNRTIKEDKGQVESQPVEFLVDMTPPAGDVTGVADNEIYNAPSRTVGIHYSDNTSVKAMSLYLNDILQQEYTAEELAELGDQMSFEARSSNDWQQLKIVLTDMAGNTSEVTSGRYLLTENLWVRFINSPLMILGAVGGLAVIGAGIGLLIWRRKRRRI